LTFHKACAIILTMKTSNPEKSQARKTQRAQAYAAASSMGYNMLGAQTWQHPGIVPKVVAVGLGLKAARDYTRAWGLEPVIAKEPRQRIRGRFDDFMEVWSQDEGTSLKNRLKRSIGTEALNFRDKEFQLRFNRMMGGMAFGLAGVDLIATGTTPVEKTVGTIMAIGGAVEHIHNQRVSNNLANELHNTSPQQSADVIRAL
jgi:hypothetical protein